MAATSASIVYTAVPSGYPDKPYMSTSSPYSSVAFSVDPTAITASSFGSKAVPVDQSTAERFISVRSKAGPSIGLRGTETPRLNFPHQRSSRVSQSSCYSSPSSAAPRSKDTVEFAYSDRSGDGAVLSAVAKHKGKKVHPIQLSRWHWLQGTVQVRVRVLSQRKGRNAGPGRLEIFGQKDAGAQISLNNVFKTYGDRTVLDGVSLHLTDAEVVGLLGPNGAGKSTAFGILVGRDRPSQGAVLLDAEDITNLPLEARASHGIGYLPQEASIFRGLSVADNIRLVLQETGVPRDKHEERLEKLLCEFQLEHVSGTLGRSLSGGERRRAELARALAANGIAGPPRILCVDEPFAGVDPIGVQEIQAILRRLCDEKNMGIFITDHNVDETLQICDRAYMMYNGKVMASGTPDELYRNDYVRRYYLGEKYVRWPDGKFEDATSDVVDAR